MPIYTSVDAHLTLACLSINNIMHRPCTPTQYNNINVIHYTKTTVDLETLVRFLIW